MRMKCFYILLLLILTPCTLAAEDGAARRAASSRAVRESFLSKQGSRWKSLTDKGLMDSVIITARPYLKEQEQSGFIQGAAYASYYIAQAYHFKGMPDSAEFYLNTAKEQFHQMNEDPTWQIMLYNLQALTAIKSRLDYPEGISCLENALSIAWREKQHDNEVILLCNRVTIYYNRRDTLPRPYAENAYEISRRMNSGNMKCYAAICMGETSILRGDTSGALKYLDEADSLALAGGISHMKAPILLLYGDDYKAEGDKDKAATYYREALKHVDSSAPEVEIELCAAYGSLLSESGELREAEHFFRRGLGLSMAHHDREQLHNLYHGLAEVFQHDGQKDSALKYYILYNEAREDSAVGTDTERQLGKIWQKGAGDTGKDSRPGAAIAAATIIAVCAAAVLMRRKNKKNKATSARKSSACQDEILYKQIQDLMRKEKLYCDNDLSLVKLAERLGTNRTYVSKVINTCTGTNFLGYINRLRIDRAEALLSDPDYDKPLKVLSDELGYNSLSVFYRAFQRQTGVSPSKYRTEHRFRNS